MTIFGQVVVGPPGAGKTTYCDGMAQFLTSLGRKTAIVNIDPANDALPFNADIDISELITLEDVMTEHKLGPNGGLIYCMEFLEQNIEWLTNKLKEFKECYVIIDCPGQVELYTHNGSVKNILGELEKFGTRLCSVNLIDSHYCSDPSKFISVCLTSLNMMMQLELPHVNVLSKVDLIQKYGKLQFNVDFYTEVMDLEYLLDVMGEDPFMKRFKKMNEAITDLIQNYSLVSFVPLSIKSKERMLAVKNCVDKANGYVFGTNEENYTHRVLTSAFEGTDYEYTKTAEVREKYLMDVDEADDNIDNVKKGKFQL